MKRRSLIVSIVLIVALISILAVTATACNKEKQETVVTSEKLEVKMFDKDANTYKYYVGTQNALDLTKAFPGATAFAGAGASGTTIAKDAAKNGELTFKDASGNAVKYNVYAVDAFNVYGENMEADMLAKLNAGTSVVMHEDLTTKGGKTFSIKNNAHVYGNGKVLNAHSICAPKDQKKSKKTSWGSHVFNIGDGKSLNIQDLHVYGNMVAEGKPIVLEDFEFSGNVVDISADVQADGNYIESTIKNCILENGQKIIHIHGANVKIDGCIIRNGADANIASGTCPKKGAHITLKNTISADSMVAGFLFYGYEAVPENDTKCQQTLNIEGFFDNYNWKTTTTAKLVPATENIGVIKVADIVNSNVQKEVGNKDFADYLYPVGDTKYVHIGIVKLATGKCKTQNPTITYEGKNELPPQYADKSFPLPGWVQSIGIVKSCKMVAYKNVKDFANGEKPYIMPGAKMPIDKTIFEDLAFGRK